MARVTRIKDGRGQKFTLYRTGLLGSLRSSEHEIEKGDWKWIRGQIIQTVPWVLEWIVLEAAILVIMVAICIASYWIRIPDPLSAAWAFFLILQMFVAAVVIEEIATGCRGVPSGGKKQRRKIVNIFLSARRCPSCGYSLVDVTQEADGCIICSECGAAWQGTEDRSKK